MKHIFNAHALVSVKIVDKQEDYHYYYQEYRKGSFWTFSAKEGWRHRWDDDYWTEEDILSLPRLIEDKVVYYRPYAKLTFTNGQTYTKNFNTYEEALTWGREQANTGIQVRLEF